MNVQEMGPDYEENNEDALETPGKPAAENVNISTVRVNESIGAMFLGVLTIFLLILLVRSNRRNRELLLEVISLKKQP